MGTAVSARGAEFILLLAHDPAKARPFKSLHFPEMWNLLPPNVRLLLGSEVGNPYDCGAGRRVAKAPTWACRSVGRSLPWHGRGPEFKSRHVHRLVSPSLTSSNHSTTNLSNAILSCSKARNRHLISFSVRVPFCLNLDLHFAVIGIVDVFNDTINLVEIFPNLPSNTFLEI